MGYSFKKIYALLALSFIFGSFIRLILERPTFTVLGYGVIIILSVPLYMALTILFPQKKQEDDEHLPLILTVVIAIMPYIAMKFSGAILGMIILLTLAGGGTFYCISRYFFKE